MRLLHVHRLEFQEYYSSIPPYAIASHRWKRGTEASIEDVRTKCNTDTEGYRKVKGFAEYVKAQVKHVEWLWIDTCCINQESSQEVSEAINSMFKWYRNAEVCLAYMADVTTHDDLDMFKQSEWFRRGWTLQELLAPRTVVFLTADWQVIGHKGGAGRGKSGIELRTGPSVESQVVACTRIPSSVLQDFGLSKGFTVDEKLEWIAGRETMREEDMSYSLLGIFDLSMSVRYGEGGEKARKRLLAKIDKATGAGKRQPIFDQRGEDSTPRPCANVPFRRDSDFVDRGFLLDRVREKLTLPAGRAALVGLGGVGKSQLAIEYAYRARVSSPETWVFWIHASNAARFEQGMRDVADIAKIDGREDSKANILKLVRDWLLDRVKGRWMIVLDNVDDAGFLFEDGVANEGGGGINTRLSLVNYLPVCDHGSILVTTRSESAAVKLVERADTIAVTPMDKETAAALLEKKLGRQDDRLGVSDLLEALEYMPLAITQAAAYINQRGRRCSVREYVSKLRKSDRSKRSVLDVDAEDLRRDGEARNAIILTWQISFDQIQHDRPSAAELLSLMSFCDRQAIPEALVRLQRSRDDGIDRAGERGRSGPADGENNDSDSADDNSDQTSSDGSHDGFDDDLTMLEGYSFVYVTTDPSVFEMHALVQLATRRWLESQGQLEEWKEQYIKQLFTVFPRGDYENWPICQVYFPHVKTAIELKPKKRQALLNWARVLYNAAVYLWSRIGGADMEKMAMLSMQIRAKELGESDEKTLASKAMVVNIKISAGRWKEAEDLAVQLLEMSKKVLGEENPNTLIDMNNLALIYSKQGRWNKAEELQMQVLKSQKKMLGEQHPDTLVSISNLTSMYREQGRWAEAEKVQVQVLKSRKKVLGEEHPDTLNSINNLASTYYDQRQWAEAEELQVQVLEIRKKVLGEEHPDTLTSMNNLAHVLNDRGYHESALALLRDCTSRSARILGAEHPKTIARKGRLEKWMKSSPPG